MADPCWDDGLILVPDPADDILTMEEIAQILNNNMFAINAAFRPQLLNCLRPHMETHEEYDQIEVVVGRKGLLRYIATLT